MTLFKVPIIAKPLLQIVWKSVCRSQRESIRWQDMNRKYHEGSWCLQELRSSWVLTTVALAATLLFKNVLFPCRIPHRFFFHVNHVFTLLIWQNLIFKVLHSCMGHYQNKASLDLLKGKKQGEKKSWNIKKTRLAEVEKAWTAVQNRINPFIKKHGY